MSAFIDNLINFKIQKRELIAFLSTIVIGFIAHGFSFANKISFFDDITGLHQAHVMGCVAQGRWFWGLLLYINNLLFGEYSIPWLNGYISLVLIGLSSVLIIKALDIRKTIAVILASSVIIVSIGTVVMYAYMYCAVYYSLAILLSILSSYVYITYYNDNCFLKCIYTIILLFLSISIAQNYFLFGAIIVMYYIMKSIITNKFSFRFMIEYFIILLVSILIYCLFVKSYVYAFNTINKVFGLGFVDLKLVSYQGINKIASISFISLNGIFNIFRHVLLQDDILFGRFIYIYFATLIITIIYFIYILVKHNITLIKFLLLLVLFFIIILFSNSMYVLQSSTYIYSLTLHQKCLVFLVPILILDLCDSQKIFVYILFALSTYYMIYGIAFSNRITLWRYFKQQNEISWLSTFSTRLQSATGYNDDYDVYIYGSGAEWSVKKNDKYYIGEPWSLKENDIYPFRNDTLQYYTWVHYLIKWCGFNASAFHLNEYDNNKDFIKDMPCYPDDGSIQVVDNKVIVKFSEIN